MKAHAFDLAGIGLDALQPPAGRVLDRVSRLENSSRKKERESADRIDIVVLGRKARIDRLVKFLKLEPRIRFPQPVVEHGQETHLGFVMLGIWGGTLQSVQGALMIMISHGFSTGALFLLVGMLYERRHTRLIADYGGIARVVPIFSLILTVVALSSIGLPGLNGFVGEFLVLLGSFTAYPWATGLATTGVIGGLASPALAADATTPAVSDTGLTQVIAIENVLAAQIGAQADAQQHQADIAEKKAEAKAAQA